MGADASPENILMALHHKSTDPSLDNTPGSLEYKHSTAGYPFFIIHHLIDL